jgi:hypothetical protein
MSDIGDYGVLERNVAQDDLDVHVEELRLSGFTALQSGLAPHDLADLSESFERAFADYREHFAARGIDLDALGEADVIRVIPRWHRDFLALVFNERLHRFLTRILGDYFIVNQVNGLINPAIGRAYGQAKFHRDLPFRHVTLSRPIAVNALFALDDFTLENGATWVIPGSHTMEPFPSDAAVRALKRQVPVKAGTFIVLDAMTYHAGGINSTTRPRRAVNHVFTIPALRQQIHLASVLEGVDHLTSTQRKILGYDVNEYRSYDEWFDARRAAAGRG